MTLDDQTAPKPLGYTPKSGKLQIEHERLRLEATRFFGGLLPEHRDDQFWQCSECGLIHKSPEAAATCHGTTENRIQVCKRSLHRLADCTCPIPSPGTTS